MNKIYLSIILSFIFTIDSVAMDANDLINRIDNRFSKDPNMMMIASIDRTFLNFQKNSDQSIKSKKNVVNTSKREISKYIPTSSAFIPYISQETLTPVIGNVAIQNGVDPKIIHALITNESNFEPLTFNLNALNSTALTLLAQLKEQYPELKIKTYERWGKFFASLRLQNSEENIEKAKSIFEALRMNGINFDSSYMQINSIHYDRLGLSSSNIFDPSINIDAGAKIYKDCNTRYGGDLLKSVECYNKGSFKGQTSYFDKVFKTYQLLASATINPSSDIIMP